MGASNAGVTRWVEHLQNVALIRGHAQFGGPRPVRVGNRTLTAERIFINAGARARVPEFPGLEKVAYLTNSSMMEIDSLPEHLVIVGGSYIGLEFAQL